MLPPTPLEAAPPLYYISTTIIGRVRVRVIVTATGAVLSTYLLEVVYGSAIAPLQHLHAPAAAAAADLRH